MFKCSLQKAAEHKAQFASVCGFIMGVRVCVSLRVHMSVSVL